MVKSTVVGVGDTSLDEQLANEPIQAGRSSAAAPKPTCDKNSFLSIFFKVIYNSS
jgi:hypothetical protein